MRKAIAVLMILGLAGVLLIAPACNSKSGETADEAEQARLDSEQAVADAAAAAEAAKLAAPPPPKINDDVYAEIRARSSLLLDKYKDDAAMAQKELDALYEKFQVTPEEFKAFEAKQTPQHRGELERKVMDFIQKFVHEYR